MLCVKPRLVCEIKKKPHSPQREGAVWHGTTCGGEGTHLVGMPNYFCPDNTLVRQRVAGEVVVEMPSVWLF